MRDILLIALGFGIALGIQFLIGIFYAIWIPNKQAWDRKKAETKQNNTEMRG